MKTNPFSTKKISIYSLFGLSVLFLASCGSTQNSTYDNDGIYGGSAKTAQNQQTSDNKYKEYFSTLKQENQEIFTDVESYSTQNDSVNKTTETGSNGWGANPTTTTVIVYDNYWGGNWAWHNWYGPSWGWGWNSWYGPSYGWGWNNPYYYGNYWGWNNPYYYGNYWGWNNPYYGYNGYYNNHYYAYGNGRRDTRISGTRYNTNRGIPTRGRSAITPTRNNYSVNPRSNTGSTRDYNMANPRPRGNTTTTVPPRTNTANPGPRVNTTTVPPRNNTVNPRPNTNTVSPTQSAPTRQDYTPSRSNDTRSYTPSSGGGNYGGGGGGRSSGGGGGRR